MNIPVREESVRVRFLNFVAEREAIRIRRQNGCSRPWTENPILRDWFFTNIRREHDRTSIWIATHWRDPHADDAELWFAMTVARLINHPETLREIGYPVPWDRDHVLSIISRRRQLKLPIEGAAYKIGPDNRKRATGDKTVYLADSIFSPLWRDRRRLRPRAGDTLEEWHSVLCGYREIGGFYAAQVVADLKFVEPLKKATDWWSFAASGPGSRRGLNRLLGRPTESPWSELDWRRELLRLHRALASDLERIGIGRICSQNLQHAICEFDKWERARSGLRLKRRYRVSNCDLFF